MKNKPVGFKRLKKTGKYSERKTGKYTGNRELDKKIDLKELNKPVRINKYIADAGVCSRRKADALIEQGRVKVNGKPVKDFAMRVTEADLVTVDGDPAGNPEKHLYILLNKPKDTITTTNDEKQRDTVVDIVRKKERIYPVGRLDRNTTGALLLTNDGALTHRLMHPQYKVEKVYNAKLDKKLEIEDAKKIANGVELEDGMTAPCNVFIHPKEEDKVTVTLTEGRNREVRRLFEHCGYRVKQLDRKFFANLSTKGLERGEYRHLTKAEVNKLRKMVKLQTIN